MRAWGIDRETVLARIRKSICFAKANNLYTAFFAVDASRADLDFLKDAYTCAVQECGADEVVLVDTLGVASPEAMYYLTRAVKSWVDVPVAVHCHNDFGFAVACSIAAIKAGAESVHCTVNGLGEKSGNGDLAELAFALRGLYGVETNIHFEKLRHLSQLVSEITRIPVSPLKPVVGDTILCKETGSVVSQLMTYPPSVEGFAPEILGREREILLSKKSGKKSVEYALERLGLFLPPEKVEKLLLEVKKLGIKKSGIVSMMEFLELAKNFEEKTNGL
jgi:isopropylmalate/homocitrate/citramalate synthase